MSKPNDSPKGIVISVSGPVVDVLYPQGNMTIVSDISGEDAGKFKSPKDP